MINKSSPVQVQGYTNSFAQTPTKVSSSWSQLGIGEGFNIAIKQDGTLWAWGRNDFGQLGIDNGTLLRASSPVQIGTSTWSKLSTGLSNTLAIRSDGLMFEWGYNNNNQLVNQNRISYWSKIAMGSLHTIAIRQDGSLWAWGYNTQGQLGNNTTTSVVSPILIDAGSWTMVAASIYSSYGLKSDGTLYAWGYGYSGSLGNNNTINLNSPTQIPGSWIYIHANSGNQASVAGIRTNGLVYTWGQNAYGQLGDGTTINRSSPVQVAGIASTVSFSMVTVAGTNLGQMLGLDTTGRLWAWGDNTYGQLGDGTVVGKSSPVQVNSTTAFKTVSGGYNYTLAISTNNKLYAWGLNNYGQLGTNTVTSYSNPIQIGNNSWVAVAAGAYASGGIDSQGKLYTWGYNNSGSLGDGTILNKSSPILLGTSSYTNVTASVYSRNILAFQKLNGEWLNSGESAGGIYSGNDLLALSSIANYSSPVQTGTLAIVLSPAQIGTSSWTNVSAGYSHSVAVRSDNTLWGWGTNNYGQLARITTQLTFSSPVQITSTSDYSTVSAGFDYTIAVKSDSTIYGWGKNYYGQLGISTPAQTTYSWTSMGGGMNTFYAVRTDGTLWTWGYGGNGETGLNETITRSSPTQLGSDTNWSSAIGSYYSSYGIKTDGSLYAWGYNNVGQLGDGTVISRSSPVQIAGSWAQVYAGYSIAYALSSDSTLWGWGRNDYGQLGDGTVSNKSSPVQISNRSWSQIGVGFSHVIGVDTTGTLYVWGDNTYGQLGTSDTINRYFQYSLTPGKSWTNVFATQFESYAIDTNGLLYGWGLNIQQGTRYVLGDGTSITRSSPVQIGTKKWKKIVNTNGSGATYNDQLTTALIDENDYLYIIGGQYNATEGYVWGKYFGSQLPYSYTQLASGDNQTAILKADGRIYSFGNGTAGQLGDNNNVSRSSPVQVGSGATVTEGEIWRNIQTPRSASVAIRGDYKLYAWGSNSWNILGTNDSTTVVRSSPVLIASLTKSWTQLSAKYSHAVGITSDGYLYGWGTNTYNPVGFITSWTQISAGSSNMLFLRSDGTLYSVGGNAAGAVGDNTTLNRSAPIQISSDKFIKIAAGVSNTNFAISDTYKLFAWGNNSSGQLGDGTTLYRSSPVQIGTSSWLTLTATPNTTFAIRGDNTLWAWGLNESGIMNPTVSDSYSSPIQIGTSSWTSISANRDLTTANPHVLGIDINNKLYAWGYNGNGELGLGYTTQTNSWTNGFLAQNSVLVKSDGTLWTWGQDTLMYGGTAASSSSYRSSPVQVSSITKSISQVASSFSGIFVIASDSTMYAWGNNTNGYLGIPVSWKAISVGNGFGLGIRTDGTLWSWGANSSGGLGDNSTVFRSSPVQIGTASNWTTVSTKEYVTNAFAINNLGELYGWGNNNNGQLGTNNITNRSSPVQIGTQFSWSSVSTAQHTLATTTTGLLFAWGYNNYGQLGTNDTISRSSPVQVSGKSFTQIAVGQINAGSGHSLGITNNGQLYAWGINTNGQLGDSTTISRSAPVQITGSYLQVSASTSFTVAIKSDYSLYTWGGPGITRGVPAALAYSSAIMTITAGSRMYSINKESILYGAGDGSGGYLSVGTTPPYYYSNPVQIQTNNKSFVFINSRDTNATVAIDNNNKLFFWGVGTQGTRGDNTTLSASSPYAVGTDNWIYATASDKNVFGIKTDYTLWAWGGNNYGTLGLNDTISRSSPVQVAGSWTQVETSASAGGVLGVAGAIKTDGTLWTMGYNQTGTLGDGTTIGKSSPVQLAGSWTKIAVGWNSMLGIKSNGTLWGWGVNSSGQLGDGTTVSKSSPVQIGTSSWSQVDTNAVMTYAITVDGKLFAWGSNASGQLGDNSVVTKSSPVQIGSSSWVFVRAGASSNGNNAIAVDISNRVFVWGGNGGGASLGQGDTINRSSPVQFGNITTPASSPTILSTGSWTKVSAGVSSVALIDTNNKLFVWGTNTSGELGLGDTVTRYFPTSVNAATYSNVSVAINYMFALRDDNILFATGANSYVLNDGSSITRSSPVQVTGTRYLLPQQISGSWNSISVTNSNGIAVKSDGTLWTWGDNISGQLGTNEGSSANKITFTQVGSDTNWSKGVMAASQAIATKTNGTLYAWGSNQYGTLGDSTVVNKSSPIQVAGSYTVVDMGVAGTVSAIKTDGTLWTWGFNSYGTMGDGTGASKSSPVQVAGSWTNIRITGQWSTYGIQTNGSLWAWGYNANGQLGLNDAISRSSPVQVGTETGWSFTNAKTIIDYAAFSLLRNNALYAIGNGTGTGIFIYDNSTISRSSPVQVWATTSFLPITQVGNSSWSQISAGAGHSVALDPNNKLYTWGLNNAGQLATYGSFVQVNATGGVIRSDGIMYVWGDNSFGMLGDNTTINKTSMVSWSYAPATGYWQQSAEGDRHIIYLSSDGSLWACGLSSLNSYGDSTDRSSPVQVAAGNSFVAISAGTAYSLAVRNDGQLWGVGYNAYGQLGTGNTSSPKTSWGQLTTGSWTQVFSGAGSYNSFALKSDGTLYATGQNTYGNLGLGDTVTRSNWTQVPGSWTFVYAMGTASISGEGTTYGIKSDGTLWGWGGNGSGQLGQNDTINRSSPVQITAGSGSWAMVTTTYFGAGANFGHLMAWKTDGSVYTCGYGGVGVLGQGDTISRSSPVQIPGTWKVYTKPQNVYSGTATFVLVDNSNNVYFTGYQPAGVSAGAARSSPTQIGSISNFVAATAMPLNANTSSPSLVSSSSFTQIAAGSSVSAAIDSAGRLFTWGLNNVRQLGAGLNSASYYSKIDGIMINTTTGVAYTNGGNNAFGALGLNDTVNRSSPVQVGAATSWINGYRTQYYTILQKYDGTIWSTGRNTNGQLGQSDTVHRSSPTQIGSTSWNIKTLSGDDGFALLLTTTGTLYAWGLNSSGQLGLNDTISRSSPVQVPGSWVAVSGGKDAAVGIDYLGRAFTWGSNTYGQLGDNTTVNKSSPVQVMTGDSFTNVASGYYNTVLLRNDGYIFSAGYGGTNGDGLGTTAAHRSSPVQVKIVSNASVIKSGYQASYAITNDGKLYTWGFNNVYQLGQNTATSINRSLPIQIQTATSFVNVGIDGFVAAIFALDTTGTIWTWGYNFSGNLGMNSTTSSASPVQIPTYNAPTSYGSMSSPVQVGTSSYTSVSVNNSTVSAIDTSYKLYAWGNNSIGQIGDSTTVNKSSPIQIATTTSTSVFLPNIISTSSFSQVSTGQDFTIAIKKDGTLWGWGSNYYGQAVPQSRPVISNIAGSNTRFLQINGSWTTMGSNSYGNFGDNTTVARSSFAQIPSSNSYVTIQGGDQNSFGIRNDGTLWVWGRNLNGELGQNDTIARSNPMQIGLATNYTSGSIVLGYQQAGVINNSKQLFVQGLNTSGQLGDGTVVSRSSPVQVGGSWNMVSIGYSHGLGIKSDGSLWGWGSNANGQLGAVTTWTDIAAGASHILGVRSDGSLWTWGLNNIGQVGDGTTISRSSPVQIGTSSWTKVSAGPSHSVAVRADSTIWSWGQNNTCQLGDNSTLNRSSPVQVSVPAGSYVSVFASQGNSGAIKSDSKLYIWGAGNAGQIGDYSFLNRSNPVQVDGSWSQVATAQSRFMGIKTDSSLWAWGVNTYGQLGDGTTTTKSSPIQIGTSSWSQISAGADFSLGLTIDNDLFAWGINTNGQLGIGSTAHRSSPVQITTGIKYNYILASTITSYAKEFSTNLLFGWGYNGWGAIGDGTIVDKSTPSIVTGAIAINFSKLSATGDMQAQIITGLAPDNTLYYWGNSTAFGTVQTTRSSPVQIATSGNTSSPVQIGTKTDWTKVVAGQSHSVGLDSSNRLYVWGYNGNGELGLGNTLARSAPTYLGNEYRDVDATVANWTMALRKDGTVWTWGNNASGNLGDTSIISKSSPVQVSGFRYFRKIIANSNAAFALGNDNSIFTWGNQPEGSLATITLRSSPFQIGTGPLTTSISSPVQISSGSYSQISAGASHAFAIKSDSTLWGWGSNYAGRLGTVEYNSSSSNIMIAQAVVNYYVGGVILNDGTMYVMGYNAYGQLGDNTTVNKSSPVQIPGSWTSLAGGTLNIGSVYAVRSDYTLWAWGNNSAGQLGDFTTTTRSNPVQIMPQISWSLVASNNNNAYAIATDGKLFTWGGNTLVELGRSYGYISVPTQIMNTKSFAQIAAGTSSGYAIATDSTLWAWGINTGGQLGDGTTINRSSPVQISGSWSFITAWSFTTNANHTLGIKTDGTIWGWGASSNDGVLGQNDTIGRSSPVQLAAGNSWITGGVTQYNTYMIDSSYNLYGIGNTGYLNNAYDYSVSSPVQIGTSWYKVYSGGQTQAFFVNRNGSIYGMGSQTYGAFGFGSTTNTPSLNTIPLFGLYKLNDYNQSAFSSPVQISTLATSWSQISAGLSHSAGISITNELYTWGAGTNGQLGQNDTQNRNAPLKIGSSSWNLVAAGFENTTASLFTGNIYSWGLNTFGQAGDNTTISRSSPVQTTTGLDSYAFYPLMPDPLNGIQVKDTAASNGTRIIIRKDNNLLYSYGPNTYGLQGKNSLAVRYSTIGAVSNDVQISVNSPTQIPGSYSLITTGKQHVLATKTDNTLYAWGSYQNANTLKQPYKYVSGNSGTYCVIRGDNSLWAWGTNSNGNIGDGTTLYRSSPVQIAGSWSSISMNENCTMAIKTDGTLWGWGYNPYGNLGTNNTISYSSPVQIGTSSYSMVSTNYFYNSAIIDINGRLFTIGYNAYGQKGDGTVVHKSSPVQIPGSWIYTSCGAYTTLAINSDGFLFGWGYNNYGELGQNDIIFKSSPVQIGTNKYKKAVINQAPFQVVTALRGDGTLWGWGYNAYYQVDSTAINRSSPVQISTLQFKDIANAYTSNTAAISTNNTLYIWGLSSQNNFGTGTLSTPTIAGTYNGAPISAKMVIQSPNQTFYIGMDDELYGVGNDANGLLTYNGSLGTGYTSPIQVASYGTSSPVQLNSGNWTNISAGNETSVGISNQALYFWGRNNKYQSGINTNDTQISSPTVVIASKAVSTGTNTNNTGGISNS